MIDYYTVRLLSGNGRKVSIMLAETKLEHVVNFLDLRRGDQHQDWFLAINPNGKIPAIVDHDEPGDLNVGESGAILVHLAEKTGRFLPTAPKARAHTLMWTFWQAGGIGPMFGQWSFFAQAATEKIPFAIERYRLECRRLLDVLERNLGANEYAAGDYTIADMALLSWIEPGHRALTRNEVDFDRWPQIERWLNAVRSRPAVALAMSKPEGSALRGWPGRIRIHLRHPWMSRRNARSRRPGTGLDIAMARISKSISFASSRSGSPRPAARITSGQALRFIIKNGRAEGPASHLRVPAGWGAGS